MCISLKKEIIKRYTRSFKECQRKSSCDPRSTNYLRHASKMVSLDELSIVNTSVRASAARRVCFCWTQKQPRKEHGRERWRRRDQYLNAYLRTMHACARGASHNATTCGLVKCGFGCLSACHIWRYIARNPRVGSRRRTNAVRQRK